MTAQETAMAALRRKLALPERAPDSDAAGEEARLACWMIAMTQPWPDSAVETLQALSDAHRDGTADPVAWRRLRKAAVALGGSDAAEARALGRVAEAAAWPLATSSAGLVELMGAVCEVRGNRADAATGWTDEDETQAMAVLNDIARGDGTKVPERHEIPALFRAAEPQLERRFMTKLQAANMAYGGFRNEVAAWIAGATR